MVRLGTLSKVLSTRRVALCLGEFDVLSTPSAVEEVLILPISATVHYTPCRPVEKRSYYAMMVFRGVFIINNLIAHYLPLYI